MQVVPLVGLHKLGANISSRSLANVHLGSTGANSDVIGNQMGHIFNQIKYRRPLIDYWLNEGGVFFCVMVVMAKL